MLSPYIDKFNKEGEAYLKVKARPSAAVTAVKDILKTEDGEVLKIDIAAPPVNNKANIELIDFMSKEFSVFKKNVKIISGAGAKIKLLKIKK